MRNNSLAGILASYEPIDESPEHAMAFATWLDAAAQALRGMDGPKRELGFDVADWTILEPGYWKFYNR